MKAIWWAYCSGAAMSLLVQQRVGLVEKLVDSAAPGPGDSLVGGDDEALDAGGVVERLQRDDHLHRRAVRVGDDPVVSVERPGIDLADDERNVVLHAPARGVVDHDRPRRGEAWRPLPRGGASGGEQGDVEALDRILVEPPHDEAALELPPDGAGRCERHDLTGREVALAQQPQHQRPHLPRRPDHRDPITLVHAVRVTGNR